MSLSSLAGDHCFVPLDGSSYGHATSSLKHVPEALTSNQTECGVRVPRSSSSRWRGRARRGTGHRAAGQGRWERGPCRRGPRRTPIHGASPLHNLQTTNITFSRPATVSSTARIHLPVLLTERTWARCQHKSFAHRIATIEPSTGDQPSGGPGA